MSTAPRRMGEDVTLDTVQGDVWHLFHLLDVVVDLLLEMPYERNGKRDHALDKIAALTWIARDEASFIGSSIDENFREIEAGRQPASMADTEKSSDIDDYFKAWLAIRNEPAPDTDEAGDERYAQYRALQDKIIRGPAVSARDLAIMFYVDSDAGDSDNSDEFTDRVRAVAEGAANG